MRADFMSSGCLGAASEYDVLEAAVESGLVEGGFELRVPEAIPDPQDQAVYKLAEYMAHLIREVGEPEEYRDEIDTALRLAEDHLDEIEKGGQYRILRTPEVFKDE